MNVQHFEKGFVYGAEELPLLARKIGKLATYCDRLKDEASAIRVETEARNTAKSRDSVKVMVTVSLPRAVLRAESRRARAAEALDRCMEKLEPQIKRYKEMNTRRDHAHRAAREQPAIREEELELALAA
jgi:ribosomal subunit interface protein